VQAPCCRWQASASRGGRGSKTQNKPIQIPARGRAHDRDQTVMIHAALAGLVGSPVGAAAASMERPNCRAGFSTLRVASSWRFARVQTEHESVASRLPRSASAVALPRVTRPGITLISGI